MTLSLERELDALLTLLAPEAIALRRDLHRHPELSWQEHRTQAAIREWLVSHGLDAHPVARTGLYADAGAGEHFVVYRADIDALPIDDTKDPTNVPYASVHAGRSHACGHDVHTSIGALLAGAFAALQTQLPGRVRFIFQPAEEVIPSGGEEIVSSGILNNASAALAIHVDPARSVGAVGVRAGAITAATDAYEIRVIGRGGHSARPHLANDAMYAAAEVIRALYTVVPLRIDPLQSAVLNAGMIRGGEARNVIAGEIAIEGVLRCLDEANRAVLRDAIVEVAQAAASINGCRAEVKFHLGCPSVDNNVELTELVRIAAIDAIGADRVQPIAHPSTGAEDFGFYGAITRTCMIRLGVRPPDAAIRHLHTPGFDIDESAILTGARVMGRSLLRALASR